MSRTETRSAIRRSWGKTGADAPMLTATASQSREPDRRVTTRGKPWKPRSRLLLCDHDAGVRHKPEHLNELGVVHTHRGPQHPRTPVALRPGSGGGFRQGLDQAESTSRPNTASPWPARLMMRSKLLPKLGPVDFTHASSQSKTGLRGRQPESWRTGTPWGRSETRSAVRGDSCAFAAPAKVGPWLFGSLRGALVWEGPVSGVSLANGSPASRGALGAVVQHPAGEERGIEKPGAAFRY
jgi:hypothetical protein